MNRRKQLDRLEKTTKAIGKKTNTPELRNHEQWLELFERMGREGRFKGQPDFPRALAEYRTVIETARRSTDPPLGPARALHECKHVAELAADVLAQHAWSIPDGQRGALAAHTHIHPGPGTVCARSQRRV
jgi:hypothetical protein